jgi:hypothetical protein
MDSSTRNILIGFVLIIVVLAAFAFLHPVSPPDIAEASARTAVTAFGTQLQKVSLLAPDAANQIATQYGEYVTHALLASWQATPKKAPGRLTSSPWPDHIQITSAAPQGTGYVVSGGVVLMTSAGLAGVIPVVMQVVPQDGKWLIAAYQEQATSTSGV